MAVSSRNPQHLVAGDNDYRSVDLPFVTGAAETGDAWLGFFTSYDGGHTWSSVLVPGYPQDTSTQGKASPIYGLNAGADPVVRPGTNGMFYYSGLAFNRNDQSSSVFVARYIDDNNIEGGNSIRYISTSLVATGNANNFLDKPTVAVDIPRAGAKTCVIPAGGNTTKQESFLGGRMYVAYTQFTGPEANNDSSIMFSESSDCGVTWSAPLKISGSAQTNQGAAIAIDPNTGIVYIAWRVFASAKSVDSIQGVALLGGSGCYDQFTPVVNVTPITPFDQGTTDVSFRTNAYPSLAVDGHSNVYLAYSQRGVGPGGDARIQIISGAPVFANGSTMPIGVTVKPAITVDNYNGRGHQIMPALAYSAGKLTAAWYDFRDDGEYFSYAPVSSNPGQYTFTLEPDGNLFGGTISPAPFASQIADPAVGSNGLYPTLRHTVDVRAAQALSALPPVFGPSVLVSQYDYGSPTGSVGQDEPVEQLDFDAPNLPMFESGTVPFVGDYIDIAGPTFIPTGSTWRYNNLTTDPDHTHVVWTDNRNVIPPPAGYTWNQYQPPGTTAGQSSVFNGSALSGCSNPNLTGMRNQDIYTATLSPGIILAIPGNTKPLSTTLQRQFAVNLENTTTQTLTFQLVIGSQPTGGVASFVQFPAKGQSPTTTLQVTVPGLSSASRSLFVTSSSSTASVVVTAEQLTGPNGTVVSGGLTSSATINPDVSNPTVTNTSITTEEVYNPNIANPNIANPNIANPNIANPNIANPNIANPNIANPNIANPNIANPNIANPNIANPNIANPNIANPNIANTSLSDVNYTITNTGNTTSSYSVQVLANQQIPSGIAVQLIVSGVYTTPYASGCTLSTTTHYVPLLNETNPTVLNSPSQIPTGTPTPSTPSVTLPPGATALVTLRIAVPNSLASTYNSQTLLNLFTPVVVSNAANTGSTTPVKSLAITTPSLNPATVTGAISQTLQAYGGTGTGYTWSFVGTAPSFLSIGSATGILSGTPTSPSTYSFTVQVADSGGNKATKTFSLLVNSAPAIVSTALNSGEQSVAYTSQQISASGGTGTLTYTATGLPNGLSLSTAGLLAGTPAASGTFSSVKITVTDANQIAASKTLSLTIASPVAIATATLPTGYVGSSYSQPLFTTAGTGSAPFTWSLVSGTPPSGLTVNSNGTITGMPQSSGPSTFTVKVTDSLGGTASQLLSLTINNALAISSTALNPAEQNAPFGQSLAATGGATPYTWSSSTLPAGLAISSLGVISGAPTVAPGTYNAVNITVTDATNYSVTKTYSLSVATPVGIATTALPTGDAGTAYSQPLSTTAASGVGPFTWSLASGTPPANLTVNSNGTITGTPQSSGGPASFTVKVTDGLGGTATQLLSLTINTAPAITTPSLNSATSGTPYSQTLQGSGGSGGYTWALAQFPTVPPNGLTINSSTGTLNWTPTGTGSFPFTVILTDSIGTQVTHAYTLAVNPAPYLYLLSGGSTLPEGEAGQSYSTSQVLDSGGTPPLVWSATGLPNGVTINSSNGALSGIPAAGTGGTTTFVTYNPSIMVTDANGAIKSLPLTLVVAAPLSASPQTFSGEQGTPLNITLASTGGVAPLFWNIPANIPGLTYSSAGTITGTPQTSGQYLLSPVTVTDALGNVVSLTVTVNLASAPALVTPSVPNQVVNTAITPIVLQGTGGSGTYTNYALYSGTLPGGVSINNGQISGTPTVTGIFTFSVAVTDTNNATGVSGPYTMDVGPQVTVPPPPGFTNSTYPATLLQATGGSGNYTWSGATGIYNMMLTPDGLLTGYPDGPNGSGTDTVTVTDTTTNGYTTVPYTIEGSTITTQAPYAPFTVTNVTLNGNSSPLQIVASPGTTVTTSFTATLAQVTYCPDCIDQVTVGIAGQAPQYCLNYGVPGTTGLTDSTGTINVNLPNTPGRYYLVAHKAYQDDCTGALTEQISTSDIVLAAIDVIPTTVQIGPASINSVTLNGQSNYGLVNPVNDQFNYPAFSVGFNFTIPALNPAQYQELIYSFNTDTTAQICTFSANTGVTNNSGGGNLIPPLISGTNTPRTSRYYVSAESGTGSCASTNGVPWLTGIPGLDFTKVIGVVDIQ